MSENIDTGMILEALNDKTDRDCRNVDTTSGADVVIEWQAPTAENNYTWYRLYKSGWVEQGGVCTGQSQVTLPKVMSDTNYTALVTINSTNVSENMGSVDSYIKQKTTSQIQVMTRFAGAYNDGAFQSCWQVSGFAAQS